ncbi:MAG: DUF3369 domain-containing protein [Desulfovibrio sp.]
MSNKLDNTDDLLFSDDEIIFAEDQTEKGAADTGLNLPLPFWKVLIVDDEIEVHKTTELVLNDFEFEGYGIEFFNAYSAEEALKILSDIPDIAVVLLDVVMETPDAGLKVAELVRTELQNALVRIILRTGQPGQAPEREVTVKFDINDYKQKAELTSSKLFSTVYTAIRSYRDMTKLEQNKEGLEKIIQASAGLFEKQSIKALAQGVLLQLSALFGTSNALYLSGNGFAAAHKDNGDFTIIAGTGNYSTRGSELSCPMIAPEIRERMLAALHKECIECDENGFFTSFTANDRTYILYIEDCRTLDSAEYNLLTYFANNIAIAFKNLDKNTTRRKSHKEIIHRLSDIIEIRKDSNGHTSRVANLAQVIGKAAGMDREAAAQLHYAAPLHDVGKALCPAHLLLKKEPLIDEEFLIIKNHTESGRDLLESDTDPVLQLASKIAYEHHENWDGTGYPQGLSGDEICLEARIVSLVEVFEVLGSERVYATPWGEDKILDYIQSERGKKFDPTIVDVFFSCYDELDNYLC